MKNDIIVKAYNSAAPAPGAEERIWARVSEAAAQTETGERSLARGCEAAAQTELQSTKRHPALRRALLAAACVAMLAALLTAGYAAYERWKLPTPTSYTPDAEGGNVAVHAESGYTLPTDRADPAEAEPLSDEYFLLRAREILGRADVSLADGENAVVRRQTHLYWNRKEVEVSWNRENTGISVTFDAEKGVFIGMSGIEWVLEDQSACTTQSEADALATRYYKSLPVEQGYVMQSCEKYDEQYWSYDFCREVEPGLYSWYECVRIAINPVSGGLEGCRVFYVPLLDDHQAGDLPLTEEDALEVLREHGFHPDGWDTVTVKKAVGLPNWMFTDQADVDLQASDVSRLCWSITLYRGENDDTPFSTTTHVMVDYYTGEILGGDTTG